MKDRKQTKVEQAYEAALRASFDALRLPKSASDFLIDMWFCIQMFDDVADGDEVSRDNLDRVLWSTLVGMPMNPFYASNAKTLLPVIATQILKWQGSDKVEQDGKADARSYVWRAGYYDLVLIIVQLCHGYEAAIKAAPTVLALYGEKLEDYLKEFNHA